MKTEYATIKKHNFQIHGFCATPVILDYAADTTTPTVFLLCTVKDLAVASKLSNQEDMLPDYPYKLILSLPCSWTGKTMTNATLEGCF